MFLKSCAATLGVVLTLAACFLTYNIVTADKDLENHVNPPIARMTLQQKASHMISYLNEDGKETTLCTGTAVGPHEILTAAHCNDGARSAVSDQIKIDYSDHHYNILNTIDDDRDHQIYYVDGPAFTNIVKFTTSTPIAGETVHFYGFGEGVYPSSLRVGRVRAYDDPSDINAATEFYLIDMLAYHGDSGSAIYDSENEIIGLVSYGITWYGHEKTGVYTLAFTQEQLDGLTAPKGKPEPLPVNPFLVDPFHIIHP